MIGHQASSFLLVLGLTLALMGSLLGIAKVVDRQPGGIRWIVAGLLGTAAILWWIFWLRIVG